jgi:osmotically inducible lipoprotein OsmB
MLCFGPCTQALLTVKDGFAKQSTLHTAVIVVFPEQVDASFCESVKEGDMNLLTSFLALVLVVALLVSCAGMTTQQQRILSGGAIGAGAGAAIGAVTGGSVVGGAAIGAAGGAAGGFLYDRAKK